MREESKEKNRRIADKTFIAVFDPTETHVAPRPDTPVPFLNFAPLQNALTACRTARVCMTLHRAQMIER